MVEFPLAGGRHDRRRHRAAALSVAQGHHGGEEEAARDEARAARRGARRGEDRWSCRPIVRRDASSAKGRPRSRSSSGCCRPKRKCSEAPNEWRIFSFLRKRAAASCARSRSKPCRCGAPSCRRDRRRRSARADRRAAGCRRRRADAARALRRRRRGRRRSIRRFATFARESIAATIAARAKSGELSRHRARILGAGSRPRAAPRRQARCADRQRRDRASSCRATRSSVKHPGYANKVIVTLEVTGPLASFSRAAERVQRRGGATNGARSESIAPAADPAPSRVRRDGGDRRRERHDSTSATRR